jgi:hypothetical protein
MSKENSKYTIRNRTRDLSACRAVVKQECCGVILIYYFAASFKCWCELPEDGVNYAETCSCTMQLFGNSVFSGGVGCPVVNVRQCLGFVCGRGSCRRR